MNTIPLNLRKSKKGGNPTDKYLRKLKLHVRRLLIIIHGYNVNEKKANKYYNRFLKYFDDTTKRIGLCFWPGDQERCYESVWMYPEALENAKRSAEFLFEFIKELKYLETVATEVHIVAHSLGCRLVLEGISRSSDKNELMKRLKSIFLMAAAVPRDLVQKDRRFERGSRRLERKFILYSPFDVVLAGAFPVGQYRAYKKGFEDQFYHRALGLSEGPSVFQTDSLNTYRFHNGYWKHKKSAHFINNKIENRRSKDIRKRKQEVRKIVSRKLDTYGGSCDPFL